MSHPVVKAQIVADWFRQEWMPHCDQIEIAGSIRRQKGEVKDIELVALPKYHVNLFGEPGNDDMLLPAVRDLMSDARLVWRRKDGSPVYDRTLNEQVSKITWGRKYLSLYDRKTDIPLDLFISRPPSNYWWLFVIRTGPAKFSKDLMVRLKKMGLYSDKGAIYRPNKTKDGFDRVDFQSEEEVFTLLEMKYIEPRNR
jgi:DNA polymerase/3'-5' exonuclease PolX